MRLKSYLQKPVETRNSVPTGEGQPRGSEGLVRRTKRGESEGQEIQPLPSRPSDSCKQPSAVTHPSFELKGSSEKTDRKFCSASPSRWETSLVLTGRLSGKLGSGTGGSCLHTAPAHTVRTFICYPEASTTTQEAPVVCKTPH